MSKVGISGLSRKITNKNNFVGKNLLTKDSILSTGRVTKVYLDPSSPDLIGCVEYVSTKNYPQDISTIAYGIKPIARPLFANITKIPLVNEIIILIQQPGRNLKAASSDNIIYYMNAVNVWNHPHHSAIPFSEGNLLPTQQKNLQQIQAGSSRIVTNQPTEIYFGTTFQEKDTVNPLLPFEGDVIYEGRWGNSIRFSSTVKTINNQNSINNWSSGSNPSGDPVTIIRNGQGPVKENGYDYITEDINNDDSSIYLTSTQKIPLQASSTNYFSYNSNPPQFPDQYQGKQIIINSGRLVFNTTEDHLLLSSAQSINLSSNSGVNIDTSKFVVQTQNIYLGSKTAKEPLLLGNQTVNLLNQLINNLSGFMTICSTAVSTPPGTPLIQLNVAASQVNSSLLALQANLESIKSKYNYTV